VEFHEKLQELRKHRGLTQEELAAALFVSRTAVSKWESGRGYPNIDSLKAIAKFFAVTVDELLSGEQVLDLAQKEAKEKEKRLRLQVLGMMDASAAVHPLLPLFARREDSAVRAVTLLETGMDAWMKAAFIVPLLLLVLLGALMLVCGRRNEKASALLQKGAFIVNALGALLFTAALQPYAACVWFVYLLVRVFFVCKNPMIRSVSAM